MAEDIVPSLLQTINKQFDAKAKESTKLKSAVKALQSKKATYRDANEYAIEVGNILAGTLGTNINTTTLPDGKMYFNIADRVLNETLQKNFDLISGYAGDVQALLNEQAGLHLEVKHPEFNKDKVSGIVNRISSEDDFENVEWIVGDPIVNFSQSVVDDSIDANIKFQSKIGLHPLITRRLMGRACKWCANLAGTYNYVEAPHDIYRRHERCRCIVEYNPGTGKRQDVWSKQWRTSEEDAKLKARKEAGNNQLTNDERAAIIKYVGSESYKLNDMLRRGLELPPEYAKMLADLNSGLDKMPRYEGQLNRSITAWNDEFVDFIKSHEVGSLKQYRQFLSFATDVYNPDDDARLVIRSASQGADLRRFNKAEQEVLYKPTQQFVVADRYLENGKPTIILEEKPDD